VTSDIKSYFAGRRVVVTGAAGTIGSEVVRTLLDMDVAEVRGIDNHENGLFFLSEALRDDKRFHSFVCDVRSASKLNRVFSSMDFCFHTAALKHVPSSERSPTETVQTNIIGVQNVIQAALDNKLKRVLFTSSDKAVNPTNVMGTTKLMGERLITAANAMLDRHSDCVFTTTRFGNVAGSAGSVVPLFCQQIAKGGPITLTHNEMTRFVMTLSEAVRLMLESIKMACGGEVFVTKMPVVRIIDIAYELIDMVAPLYGYDPKAIQIREIGVRPGEKLYEELTTHEELRRTLELDELFAVLPAFRNIYDGIEYNYDAPSSRQAEQAYSSETETAMSRAWVRNFLLDPAVLPVDVAALLAAAERARESRFAGPTPVLASGAA
jgi:FlaA1/EpsC-like NDP-sugar epimerase